MPSDVLTHCGLVTPYGIVELDISLTHWPLGNLNDLLGTYLLDLTDDKSTLVQVINGLVPSGNQPLPEPMLTQISVAIWRHQATTS